jgi:hypothetical protein
MLAQITHWMQVAGTVLDGILLLRILSLRLHRTYLFITLACTVGLLFDITDLWFGNDRTVSTRLFVYSRFVWVVLFPLVVWDVFQEIKMRISPLRRLAVARLISGMFFTLLLAFVMAAFINVDAADVESPVLTTMGLVLWAGAATASLAFLITMHRVLRLQTVAMPNNTSVWMRFYEWSLAAEVVSCFVLVLLQLVTSQVVKDAVSLAFLMYGIVITVWCVWKLRRIPSENMGQAGEHAPL